MTQEDTQAPAGAGQGPLRRLLAILDYDGTVTAEECNELVLQRLVGDAWRPFEDEVKAGRMGHAECFDRQIRLIRAPRAQFIGALVEAARPAPGLKEFLQALTAGGGRAVVVSAGFREAIEAFWAREGLPPAEVYASELVADGPGDEGPYHIGFNPDLGDCPRCGPASCKGRLVRRLRRPGDVVLAFGDGDSDLCSAREAHLTFARGWLAEQCRREGLAWRPLDFADATALLPELARQHTADGARARTGRP
jgi:HAD superfamily phosphoserine phosphatase-like hydrolase